MIESWTTNLTWRPCWDSLVSGRPVLEPDLRHAPRRVWPLLSGALAHEPIAALFAFPMSVAPSASVRSTCTTSRSSGGAR